MKKLLAILLCSTAIAASAQNVDPSQTVLWLLGDSTLAHTGQASPVQPTLTNMFYALGTPLYAVSNLAVNGSGSIHITNAYFQNVRPYLNPTKDNVVLIDVGANDNELETNGGALYYIGVMQPTLLVMAADGCKIYYHYIRPNWRSTNDVFGDEFETQRALANFFLQTNGLLTKAINLDPPFSWASVSVSGSIYWVDNPPLHPSDLGAAFNGTNDFLAMTTNAVPPRYLPARRADYLEQEINLAAREEPPIKEPEEDPRFHAFAQFKRAPGIRR